MSGFRSKQLITFMGRGHGKSVWSNIVQELTMPNIELLDSAEVDGKIWHTVKLNMLTADWVRTQDKAQWTETTTPHSRQNYFDIHETLYTLLMLKWN